MDIIRDILDRVFLGDASRSKEEIERELRKDYGGERVYVSKTGDQEHAEVSRRNAAIRADWLRGERMELLVRRYRITSRRIYKIVNGLP